MQQMVQLLKKEAQSLFNLKKSQFLFLILISITVVTSSYTYLLFHDLKINYSVKGVYQDLNDGITLAEFNELTLTTNQDLEVVAFEVTLARGNRPVKNFKVNGNTFNLRSFIGNARPGDYIAIEIKKLSGPRSSRQALFQAIRVN